MSELSPQVLKKASKQAVANLYEGSGRAGALPQGLKCVGGKPNLCGPAFPVLCPPGSNIWFHKAIYQGKPGDILAVATLGNRDFAYLGDLMVEAAIARNLGGIVIEGCVRDIANLQKMPLPVFAYGSSVSGPGKAVEGGQIESPIQIGEITISKGDLVRGDEDGVVVVKKNEVEAVLKTAVEREKKEDKIRQKIREEKARLYEVLKFDLP